MRAAFYGGPGKLDIREIPAPTPGPGEVLLRVGANTVCGTDGRVLRGEKPASPGVILGHEVAGTVAAVGSGVKNYREGQTAGLCPIISCGNCYQCRRDLEQFCSSLRVVGFAVNGGLADYVLLDSHTVSRGNLITAPLPVSPEVLALAEPLSCCLSALRRYRVEAGDAVLIMGAGPIGRLHAMIARLRGARAIYFSDPSAKRRQSALEWGADGAFDPTRVDVARATLEATGGRGAQVVIIAIGKGELFATAVRAAAKGGRVNLFAGFPAGGQATIDPNDIHYGELEVTGASNARRADYEDAVALICSGQIDAPSLLTHRYPLERAAEAIEFSTTGEGLKIAVVPN